MGVKACRVSSCLVLSRLFPDALLRSFASQHAASPLDHHLLLGALREHECVAKGGRVRLALRGTSDSDSPSCPRSPSLETTRVLPRPCETREVMCDREVERPCCVRRSDAPRVETALPKPRTPTFPLPRSPPRAHSWSGRPGRPQCSESRPSSCSLAPRSPATPSRSRSGAGLTRCDEKSKRLVALTNAADPRAPSHCPSLPLQTHDRLSDCR